MELLKNSITKSLFMPLRGTLRTCPSCGHKSRIKPVNERLLSDRKKAELVSKDGMMIAATGPTGGYRWWGKVWSLTPTGPQERETFSTRTKEFEDSFMCGRCGHRWSERHTEETERV